MNKQKYYDEIDALKGIAIFLVILGHSIIVYPIDLHQNALCASIFDFISTVHMPLFFIISGYNYSYNGNYKEFIFKKIKRLLIPYFVFNLLEIIPRVLLSNYINSQIDIAQFIKNMFLYGGNYWFIYVLFIYYLLLPFINSYIKKYSLAFVIVSIFLNIFNPGQELFTLNLVFRYLPFLAVGYALSIKYDVFENKIKSKALLMLCTVISIAIWVSLFIFRDFISYSIYYLLVSFAGIISLYLITSIPFVVKLFKEIGKYSLPLYLLSGFALVVSRTIICMFTENPFIIIMFNLIVDLLVPFFFIKYILIKNKVLKVLIGQ